jgi:hypothetical protein
VRSSGLGGSCSASEARRGPALDVFLDELARAASELGHVTARALYNKTPPQPHPNTVDQSEAVVVVHANHGRSEWRDVKAGNSWAFLPVS